MARRSSMILPRSEWAFSGAGTLAGLHVGAAAALWEYTRPSTLVGTSAGAAVAALIALGREPHELRKIVVSADYAALIPFNPWLAAVRRYLASAGPVTAWLRGLTEDQTLGDCQIPLTCIASDLTTGRAALFSTAETPDMPVWQAVLASMSIPDVFPAFAGRHVDGGVLCNLGAQYLPGRHRRVGLRVVEAGTTGPVDGFIDEQERLVSMMLSAGEADLVALGQHLGVPIIDLPGGKLGFLDRGMSAVQKESLYQAGWLAAQRWIQSREGKEWMA
jgi:predicted acylesterase/phospholipase RssA